MRHGRDADTAEARAPLALRVAVTDDVLSAELSDGRTIAAPLGWYPRLTHATREERDRWQLIGGGAGVHWPDLDEDISIGACSRIDPQPRSQTRSGGGWRRGAQRAR